MRRKVNSKWNWGVGQGVGHVWDMVIFLKLKIENGISTGINKTTYMK